MQKKIIKEDNHPKVICLGLDGLTDLLVLLGVLLPLVLGLIYRLYHLPALLADGPLDSIPVYLTLPLALLPFIAAAVVLFTERSLSKGWILVVVFLALLSRLVYVLSVDNALISDYKTMWDFALAVQRGELTRASSIQELRAIPYFLPLAMLVDGSRQGLELINGLTTVGTGLFVFFITRDLAGARAGLAALILAMFAPEPIFACEVATHDIPGTFFLMGSIACFHFGYKYWKTRANRTLIVLLLIALSGLMLGMTEVQRSTGKFLLITFVLVLTMIVCCAGRDAFQRNLAWRVLPPMVILLTLILSMGLVKNTLLESYSDPKAVSEHSQYNTWAMIATFSGPKSTGDYGEFLILKPEFDKLDPKAIPEFAIRKIAKEYTVAPLGFASHYAHKAERLYNFGRQGREYYGESVWRQLFDAYTGAYAVILLLISFFTLAASLSLPREKPEHLLPLFFLSILSLALILFGEIQSRYAFSAWFILPIYITVVLSRLATVAADFHRMKERVKRLTLITLLVSSIVIVALYPLVRVAAETG